MFKLKLPVWATILLMVLSVILTEALPQLWQWKESRLGEEKHQMENVRQTTEFRDKIEDKLAKLFILARQIEQEKDEGRKAQMRMQFDLAKDDLLTTEKKLAVLEKREPRDIFKALDAPPAPGNFTATIK